MNQIPNPFNGIERKLKDNGYPLEENHVKFFDSLNEGDTVSFNVNNTGLKEGWKIVSKDRRNLTLEVEEAGEMGSNIKLSSKIPDVRIEDVRDNTS